MSTAIQNGSQRQPWPDGVTARILTRAAILLEDFRATVDIIDNPDDGNIGSSTAHCRPCGWNRRDSLPYRDKVLAKARGHADECKALPNPTA